MGGEKINSHEQTLKAPSRPLGFHFGSVTSRVTLGLVLPLAA